MKMKSAILITLLIIAALAVAGCTTTTGGGQSGTTATTTTTTTTQPSGPGPGVTYVPCSRNTVSGNVLANFLPSAQAGGQADEPFFMNWDIPGEQCQYAAAMNSYAHGNLDVDVMIYDFNYYSGLYGAMWGYGYQTDTGYAKSVNIQGYPGWEIATTTGDQDILLWVDSGNGILVWVFVEGKSDTGLLYQYANAINYGGLAGLA